MRAAIAALIGEEQFAFLPDRLLKGGKAGYSLLGMMPASNIHVNALTCILGFATRY